jgi:hypothetical protein
MSEWRDAISDFFPRAATQPALQLTEITINSLRNHLIASREVAAKIH